MSGANTLSEWAQLVGVIEALRQHWPYAYENVLEDELISDVVSHAVRRSYDIATVRRAKKQLREILRQTAQAEAGLGSGG